MKRVVPFLAAAFVLLVPASAFADTVWTLRSGTLRGYSDDPSINGEYRIWVEGSSVHVREPKDPEGNNVPIEGGCGATGFNSQGLTASFQCPKGSVTAIVVEAGPGEDTMSYEVSDIPLSFSGGTGLDKVTASDAADDLSGEQGNDTLTAGAGDDILNGDDGNDALDGGAGNDKLTGGNGTDSIVAGDGDDSIVSADGLAETVDCGAGNDTVTADTQDTLTGCENVTTQNIASSGGNQPTGNDTTRPKVDYGGSGVQRYRGAVRFVATCSERGVIQAAGYVDADGLNSALHLKSRKVKVGGGGVVIKLPFPKRVKRLVLKDLRRKRTPRVRVTLSCVDAAGNTSRSHKFWIKLRRR